MKVLLAVPPEIEKLEIYKIIGMRVPPLGLASIAAVLEEEGHKVKIIDSPTLGLTLNEFLQKVISWNPDVIGITSTTPTIYKAYKAVKFLKSRLKDVPVIMGGQHVTFMYKEAISRGVDVVVRGEGELTTLELLNCIEKYGIDKTALKRIKGLAFKMGDEIVVTEDRGLIKDLDKLPFPARHLLPMDKYTLFDKPLRVIHLIASRGCPYGCIFCSTSYFWGRRVRFRSPENVADEIEEAISKYKTNILVFADDELTISRRFIYGLLSEFKKRGLDVKFSCGSRVDHVNRELLRSLYNNGCEIIYFGVESGSQETIDRIGKRIRLEQAERVFRWVKELGGEAMGTFVLGFPWETVNDMKTTIKFAIKLDPDYAQFTVATPYPGTPLFEFAKKENLIEDWNWEDYTTIKPVMRGYNFTRELVHKMLRYAYRVFYLRPKFLFREIRRGRITTSIKTILKASSEWLSDIIFDIKKSLTSKFS